MNRMGRSYEIALFGDNEQGHIMEIAEALDPQGRFISGRLGRESTIMSSNGRYIKDLSYLGRPLKDVIYIDFTEENVPYHKENCIILPEWKGERDDRALIDLVPFLESKSNASNFLKIWRRSKPTSVRS
jgi:TFIIF-interacting CTD phosphatase-like protein